MKAINVKMFNESVEAVSIMGGPVLIVGEQQMELEDGRVVDQYLYDVVGYTPENGKHFASLKDNISVIGELPTEKKRTIEGLVGQTFEGEGFLELEIYLTLDGKFKDMYPVLDGFHVRTTDNRFFKIFTTTTIGELTVTDVK